MAFRWQEIKAKPPRLIGKHLDCGGDVYYHVGGSMSWRQCEKCKQDGFHGTLSPVLESEAKK